MLDVHPVNREALSDQVADRLLSYIISKGLESGTRLPSEQKLADEFGVSRPVVREALRSLAGQRIIQIVNGKGAIVNPLNGYLLGVFFQRAVKLEEQLIHDFMEVRQCLEIQMARQAAGRRTEEDLEILGDLVAKMQGLEGDTAHYVKLDVEFHVAIARATRNVILFHIVASMRKALPQVISAVFSGQSSEEALRAFLHRSRNQHAAIYDAIVRQDGAGAERAMSVHLADAYESMSQRTGTGMHADDGASLTEVG
jgi:GntR family transcriptional regulator, transcriptional repressor for pyruvate dehydrogenase complex